MQMPTASPRRALRILIATDAWHPQVNGVVRTLELLVRELKKLGQEVKVLEPAMFRTVPMPSYPEIRLALNSRSRTRRIIDDFAPDAMHVATEGPIGWAARAYCKRQGRLFTTSFHTRFPEYLHARTRFPVELSYRLIRHFHRPSSALLVTTPYLKRELEGRGFDNVKIWQRGVDVEHFRPRPKDWLTLPRPIFLYVGRVAIEKNLAAFLSLDLPGSKVVVGEGPQLQSLKFRFPNAYFVGTKLGEELARYYAASDVFVFPSQTDTLWARGAGGARERRAGRRFPRAGSRRHHRQHVRRLSRLGFEARGAQRAVDSARGVPRVRARLFLGSLCPSVSRLSLLHGALRARCRARARRACERQSRSAQLAPSQIAEGIVPKLVRRRACQRPASVYLAPL